MLAKAEVKYKRPAHYDDVLAIRTTLARSTPVRLEHTYAVRNQAGVLVAEGSHHPSLCGARRATCRRSPSGSRI